MSKKKNFKEKTLLLGTTLAVGATLVAGSVNPVFADEKKDTQNLLEMSDAEYQALQAELDKEYKDLEEMNAKEDEHFKKLESVISESDWETLSDKQIDEKLKASGIDPIGNPKDPFYHLAPAAIDALSDAELQELNQQLDFDDPHVENAEYMKKIDSVISESDWETLSSSQIDEKLKKAGLDPIGDSKDPFYELTPVDIDNLSDEDFEKLMTRFEEYSGQKNEPITDDEKKSIQEFEKEILEKVDL